MLKNVTAILLGLGILWTTPGRGDACGPAGGSKGFVRGGSGKSFSGRGAATPKFGTFVAADSRAAASAKFTAQARAYRQRMKPIRLARARQLRERKLAQREQYRKILLAKLEAKRRQNADQEAEQTMYAKTSPSRSAGLVAVREVNGTR